MDKYVVTEDSHSYLIGTETTSYIKVWAHDEESMGELGYCTRKNGKKIAESIVKHLNENDPLAINPMYIMDDFVGFNEIASDLQLDVSDEEIEIKHHGDIIIDVTHCHEIPKKDLVVKDYYKDGVDSSIDDSSGHVDLRFKRLSVWTEDSKDYAEYSVEIES